nr:hypothetical protein [Paraburkholderia phenoliruptrix]
MALASVLRPAGDSDPLLRFLALQSIAGLALAIAFRLSLPKNYREPRGTTLLFLWLACTFVPVSGGLVVLINCLWAALFPGRNSSGRLADVSRPDFVTSLVSRVPHGGGSRLQARLANTQLSPSDRLSALVAIQSMPTRTTGRLLRDLLADPLEDIRLIAYGTLDHAENEIAQQIFRASRALEECEHDVERHALNRLLAELNFELGYQNLVHGAVRRHTLQQADRYAQAALETDPDDAALWLIRGRLALESRSPDDAEEYIVRALDLGFPRERLVPWLAEVDFLRGNYARVSELLGSLSNAAALPTLKPVLRYWS